MSKLGTRLAALAFLTVFLVFLSLATGSSRYTLLDILSGAAPRSIIELRVARCLAAMATGLILGLAGFTLQYTLRNPLADPYLLGVSPAAYLLVSLYALLAPSLSVFYTGLTWVALLGGLLGVSMLLIVSKLAISPLTTLLAGIAVSTSFSGMAFALSYLALARSGISPAHALFGGFAAVLYNHSLILSATALLYTAYVVSRAGLVEPLLYGDEAALMMGVEPRRARLELIIVTGLTVSIATAYTGVIGFVGLIAPNIARRIIPTVEARISSIASGLVGCIITLVADTASKMLSPFICVGEIPAGALIAVAGGFTLAALLARGGGYMS